MATLPVLPELHMMTLVTFRCSLASAQERQMLRAKHWA